MVIQIIEILFGVFRGFIFTRRNQLESEINLALAYGQYDKARAMLLEQDLQLVMPSEPASQQQLRTSLRAYSHLLAKLKRLPPSHVDPATIRALEQLVGELQAGSLYGEVRPGSPLYETYVRFLAWRQAVHDYQGDVPQQW